MSAVFLFGAGASAFSGDVIPSPPPLGSHLFDEMRMQGGVAATVSDDLAAVFREDFEAGMAEFRRRHEVETTTLVREMAFFLSGFSPGETNLYRQLVSLAAKAPRPSVFATLNYDLLIELAIGAAGYLVAYHGLPAPTRNMSVLKLHGSCNFLPDLGGGSIRGIGFDLSQSSGAILSAPVKPVGVRELQKFCREEDSLSPAMALYAKGKSVLIAPDFVRFQQDEWVRTVRTATQIYVIGVRVMPEDSHVWTPLRKSKGELYYVSPDGEAFEDWAQEARRRNSHVLAPTFQAAIPEVARRIMRV